MQVTVHKAKTHFSKLLAAVEQGEEIIIKRRDKPVAVLSGIKPRRVANRVGGLKTSRYRMGTAFDDEALNARIAEEFEGRS